MSTCIGSNFTIIVAAAAWKKAAFYKSRSFGLATETVDDFWTMTRLIPR